MSVSNIPTLRKFSYGLGLSLCLATLAACNSTKETRPTQTVRTSSTTAPTDLQLLCASTAVEQLGIASGNALPVSSAPVGANAYQVDLTFEEGGATCVIDNTGVIQSITRV